MRWPIPPALTAFIPVSLFTAHSPEQSVITGEASPGLATTLGNEPPVEAVDRQNLQGVHVVVRQSDVYYRVHKVQRRQG